MKRSVLLLFTVINLLATNVLSAKKYPVVWVKDANLYVTANSGAIAYQIPGPKEYNPYLGYGLEDFPDRDVIDYSNYSQTVIKKSKDFRVAGYASSKKQLYYDTYAIVIKDIVYLLPAEYVLDNTLIEAENNKLQSEHDKWSNRVTLLQNEYDSLRATYIAECETKYLYYKQIVDSLTPQVDSVESVARENYKAKEDSVFPKWYNTLPSSAKNAYDNKIEIISAELQSPNSAAGCDAIFVYKNKSKKTIKYLSWTCSFYNAVHDKVACDIRGYTSFTGKDTGPVKFGEEGGGLWECVIYDWAADYMKIEGISITYLDGSTTSISASDIKHLLSGPNYNKFTEENGIESEVVGRASQSLREELRQAENFMDDWKERLDLFTKGIYTQLTAYDSNVEHKELYRRLDKIQKDMAVYKHKLEEFEKKNLLR